MTNGYFASVVRDIRYWVRRRSQTYWRLVVFRKDRILRRAHFIACFIGWHTKKVEFTVRYYQLKLKVRECAHCGIYIENGARIETEVPYNVEVPFEGFKIEKFPSDDSASAFYKPSPERKQRQMIKTIVGSVGDSQIPEVGLTAVAPRRIEIEIVEAERPE
jgi:hypothetical protein